MNTTILLVDDEPVYLELLDACLPAEYHIERAGSGESALLAASREPRPSLILLDVMMSDMDGFEVCRRLKANPETRSIPVIFVTVLGQDDDEQEGFDAGGVDYITKPYRPAIIQARVRTHLALSQQQRELEQQVKQRTHQLENAKQQLETAQQAKSTFCSAMSHELRTPMNAVIGMAQLLRSTPLSEEQQQQLTILQGGAEGVMSVLGDILEFVDLSTHSAEVNLQLASIPDIIKSVVGTMTPFAHQVNTKLNVELERSVAGTIKLDRIRVKQVILSLLGNALKFTKGGEVGLRAFLENAEISTEIGGEMGGQVVCFEVEDNGPGMTEKELKLAFEPFTQLGATAYKRQAGLGLGLTNATHQAELMGGSISAVSEVGKGTTVRFQLPCLVNN